MRRSITLLALLGVLLAACTPETPPATTSTLPATTPSTTTTAPPPSDHLEVWVDDARKAVLAPFAADFAEQTGVDVELVAYPFDEIADKVLAGDRPDVFVAAHDRLPALLAQGAVAPVDIAVGDLDPKAESAVSRDGIMYGIPYGMESVALFANTDVLGGDVAPESFAELEDICASLASCVGIAEGLYHQYGFLSSSGGYVFAAVPGGGWSVDDVGLSKAVDGAVALARLATEGIVTTGPYGQVVQQFANGTTPFLITGPWQVQPFVDEGVEFAVYPLPTLDDRPLRPFVGVQAFFVSKGAPSDLAEAFVREVLARPEVLAAAAPIDNRVPSLVSARSGVDPNLAGFAAGVEEGDLLPAVPEMVTVWDLLDAALDQIYAGIDPSAAMSDAGAEVRQAVAR